MALRAVEHEFTGATNYYTSTYDSTKTTLGDLIKQYTGDTPREKYAGPLRFGRDAALNSYYGLARPAETNTSIPATYPHVVSWSDKHGYYSTGTVTVSEKTVTGAGTDWFTDGVPIGATIGFGSTDPANITTWYIISTITSATSITLQSSAGTYAGGTAFVINKSREIDWVFLADAAAAASTRRITLFQYDRLTSSFSWKGYITLTYPIGATHTIRGMRAVYAKYTTGTVSVASSNNYSTGTVTVAATAVTGSGTTFTSGMVGMSIGFYTTNPALVTQWYVISAFTSGTSITLASSAGTTVASTSFIIATTTVTGNGTTWNTDRIMIGSRIGFGSTDPTQISQWHYISGLTAATVVSSNTSFNIQSTPTANGTAGVTSNVTYASNTPYVIEDLHILTSTTNGTATSGGLFIAHGISYDDFTVNGLTIPAATTVDKVKAVYWLGDASTVTNTGAAGLAIESFSSWTVQYCHIVDTARKVYKYNFRKALTLASGKDTTTLIFATGVQSPALNGTISQTNNGRIGTLSHGTGSGVSSLYFATTTAIYRIPLNSATYVSASTTWASANADLMLENPTGGLTTYNPSGVLASVEISDQIDRLIVTNTGAGSIVITTYITGTVTVANNVVTGAGTTFTSAHVGQYIGFGTRDPSLVTTWYYISSFTSSTIIGITPSGGSQAGGTLFVISSNTPANNRCFLTQYYGTYISGTVAVSGTAVTGTSTAFVSAHAGQYIGFYTINPTMVTTWYQIQTYTSATSITLATSAGTVAAGSAFVIAPNTTANVFDIPFSIDTRQIDQSAVSNDICPTPNAQGTVLNVWSESGLVYIARTGTTALTNQLYAIPLGADWDFASGSVKQRLITPSLSTTGATRLIRVMTNGEEYLGGPTLSLSTESYRVYYRTSGITDDSGSWTLVDTIGDLTAATVTSNIQFMFEFRTIGTFCIPARIFSVTCLYQDTNTDEHYQPSVVFSSITNKRFAWRFAEKFNGTVPTLRIRLYDAVAGTLLTDDDSVTQAGTWEKSIDDGSSWITYDDKDKFNEITYIRYTRTSLSDNIKVRALLTRN